MDLVQLTQLVTIGALLFVGSRRALRVFDRAEAGFASLFVPPDRTLPWPRGVQESDSPWGWQSPVAGDDDERDLDGPAVDLEAAFAALPAGPTRYVEPPHQVDPITVRTLPQ